jgi:hypothetical protein
VKKLDKLKRQRYEISMKIIRLEAKKSLNQSELKTLEILRKKEKELDNRIDNLT